MLLGAESCNILHMLVFVSSLVSCRDTFTCGRLALESVAHGVGTAYWPRLPALRMAIKEDALHRDVSGIRLHVLFMCHAAARRPFSMGALDPHIYAHLAHHADMQRSLHAVAALWRVMVAYGSCHIVVLHGRIHGLLMYTSWCCMLLVLNPRATTRVFDHATLRRAENPRALL